MGKKQNEIVKEAADVVTAPLSLVGHLTLRAFRGLYAFFEYIGNMVILLVQTVLQLLSFRFSIRDILLQMSQLGVDSLLIVLLCLGFTGMTFSLIIGQQVILYGFGKEYIGAAVVYPMCKSLGPVLAGLILAGRAGAGITSQIGSMMVTEQIDALKAMAVNPIRYLVLPRVLAMALMAPVVTFIATFVGVILGFIPVNMDPALHVRKTMYFDAVEAGMNNDLVNILFQKSIIFGIIIGIVSCLEGFRTRGGAEGVGLSVTRSVVISMVMIFLADLVITKVTPY